MTTSRHPGQDPGDSGWSLGTRRWGKNTSSFFYSLIFVSKYISNISPRSCRITPICCYYLLPTIYSDRGNIKYLGVPPARKMCNSLIKSVQIKDMSFCIHWLYYLTPSFKQQGFLGLQKFNEKILNCCPPSLAPHQYQYGYWR